jgi:primosomal protein N' (replication factor Y)
VAELVAKIAVSAAVYAIDRPYSYKIPKKLYDTVMPGVRVAVPFGRGNKRSEGVVLSVDQEQDTSKLKCIEEVLDLTPVLTDREIKLALWMRDRFFCTVYDAVRTMLPSGMWFKDGVRKTGDKTISEAVLEISGEEALELAARKRLRAPQQAAVLNLLAAIGCASFHDITDFTGASSATVRALEKQGLLSIEHREVLRRPEYKKLPPAEQIKLNAEQEASFIGISELMKSGKAEAALLFGVTGSGKTSVYIRLIKETISIGRSAIVLVPEISLTPQMLSVFSSFFGDKIAVLHSALSSGERCDEWKRIKSGEASVVIGTRSAVFAPVSSLGLIIIDEEQEYTYKSENTPRYHARDVAKYRCTRENTLLLLGSATPSLDSMFRAKCGQYKLFELKSRFNECPLPPVIIADMTEELRRGNGSSISGILRFELEKNLKRGEQSILFLNRRGTSTLIICGQCGYTFDCPNCSVKLTFQWL